MQIRRPNNYDYNIAVTLGFTEPNPVIDLNQLEIVRTVVQDSPNKLFIGGLPCEWNEDQVSHCYLWDSNPGLFSLEGLQLLFLCRQKSASEGHPLMLWIAMQPCYSHAWERQIMTVDVNHTGAC